MNGFQDNSQSWLLAMKKELRECVKEKSDFYGFDFDEGLPLGKSSWESVKRGTGENLNLCGRCFIKDLLR